MTEEPEFLTLDEILEIHDDQIQHYGGDVGIRDRGLLESAIAMPQQSFGGQDDRLYEAMIAVGRAGWTRPGLRRCCVNFPWPRGRRDYVLRRRAEQTARPSIDGSAPG